MKPLNIEGVKKDLYLISEDGQIYSKAKKDFLNLKIKKDGYYEVRLQREGGGRGNNIHKKVAPLVARTYLSPPPDFIKEPTVNHIDRNRTNNHYSNLEWMERSENSSIRKNKGAGIENHEAKLSEQEVHEICKLLADTALTLTEIGDQYGVDKSTISNIARKVTWKSITSQYDFSSRKTIRNSKGQYEVINLKRQGGGK